MALPRSFEEKGFVTPEKARMGFKGRRLMIATEGKSDSGKTEFLLSAPGPGMIHALDRGFDAVFDNPHPPKSRRSDFGIRVVKVPASTQFSDAKGYQPYWLDFLKGFLDSLANPDARTICVDGDNMGWDLQRLAEHGTLTGIFPQTRYTNVYAARRALYYRAWDSGKIIITTNMVKDEYQDVRDAEGNVVFDERSKEPKREKTGGSVAQGFPEQEYLWQIRVRHLYQPPVWNARLKKNVDQKWGLRVMKCKPNPELVGEELWGSQATFRGLVEFVYPHIDPKEWGL